MDSRYFLVYSILTSFIVAGQTPEYALLGQSIMFNADITTSPEQILWKHDGNKVVEFDGNQEQLYGSYVNRAILDWVSADLEIDQLRYEDSGTYELEVFTKTKLDRSIYKLEVVDKVPEPTITCEMNKGSSSDESGNQATLTCSAELRHSPSLTKFEWSSNGNVQIGRNLTISLGDEHDNEVYSCTVSNPLTKESAVFTAKECYPDEDSSTALIALILIPILLGLAILFFILRCKGLFPKKREEDLEKQAAFDKMKSLILNLL
ncbi:lymphocyte function-associated antigen 3-like [Leuresthes tenuis]|uniref:lymphocyte function-associated antigen 3-like n=1 Tax=Leuresthes tenuis TaxID=355514 RepID=UPI003B513146